MNSIQLVIERNLGVDKHSTPVSLLTYHLTNTSFLSVATNLAILGTIGRYHFLTHGATSFLTVTGCGAVGGSLATANAVSKNEHYVAASSNAIGAALVTFHAFKNAVPGLLGRSCNFRDGRRFASPPTPQQFCFVLQ